MAGLRAPHNVNYHCGTAKPEHFHVLQRLLHDVQQVAESLGGRLLVRIVPFFLADEVLEEMHGRLLLDRTWFSAEQSQESRGIRGFLDCRPMYDLERLVGLRRIEKSDARLPKLF